MLTSLSMDAVRLLEAAIGRRNLWRLGRLLYFRARREGYNDPTINGEYELHSRIAGLAHRRDKALKVIDIGGFTGYWSEHLLSTCQAVGVRNVQLWSFEPSEESRAKLVERLRSAPPQYRVSIRSEAICDQCGNAAFDSDSAMVGAQRLLDASSDSKLMASSVQVSATTLAKIVAEEGIDEVDFVKSAVEGYDLSVIRGALPLLQEERIGVLQFEYNHCWIVTRSYLQDVFKIIEGLPYKLCKIGPQGLECHDRWHRELEAFVEANFALVREDLLQPLEVLHGTFDSCNTYNTLLRP